MSTPAGWYPDPAPDSADGSTRWWDGEAWTEHVQQVAAAPRAGAAVDLQKQTSMGSTQQIPATSSTGTPYPAGAPAGGTGGQPATMQQPVAAPQMTHTPDGAWLASPWKRLGASVIDGLLMFVVVLVLELLLFGIVGGGAILLARPGEYSSSAVPIGASVGLSLLMVLVLAGLLALQVWYFVIRVRKVGATFGKQWLGLRIRTFHTDGQLTYGQIWGRLFTPAVLSLLTCGVGQLLDVLWLLWDRHRQCLHDKAVGTVVVDTSIPRSAPDHPGVQLARVVPASRGWIADGPVPQHA